MDDVLSNVLPLGLSPGRQQRIVIMLASPSHRNSDIAAATIDGVAFTSSPRAGASGRGWGHAEDTGRKGPILRNRGAFSRTREHNTTTRLLRTLNLPIAQQSPLRAGWSIRRVNSPSLLILNHGSACFSEACELRGDFFGGGWGAPSRK